jgi:hypothetical protein
MCCVTGLVLEGKIIVSHNRDEDCRRVTNHLPVLHRTNLDSYYAPIDALSGGTWIGWNKSKIALVLNGGFERHDMSVIYPVSRGGVVAQVFEYADLDDFCDHFSAQGMAPFTCIVLDKVLSSYTRLVWDASVLHRDQFGVHEGFIYSSSTLYDDEVRSLREGLFDKLKPQFLHEDDIWDFHLDYGEDHGRHIHTSYNEYIKTVSTYQIVWGDSDSYCRYVHCDQDKNKLNKLYF